jgi:hypothetical protein
MRALLLAAVLASAGVPSASAEEWGASAGVGAGLSGVEPVSAVDARGDLAWTGGELGLGVRLRVVGDRFATADWDEPADWLGVVRYLVVRNQADRDAARLDAEPDGWRLGLAAGSLGSVRVGTGTLVDGVSAGAIADQRATGLHLRAGRGASRAEAMTIDLARAGVAAASAEAPTGPVITIGSLAVDPRAPVSAETMIGAAPLAAASIAAALDTSGEAWRARFALDLGWAPGLGAGVALVASGDRRLTSRVVGRARVEAGVGTAGWIPAPFGPLYLRLRDHVGDGTLLDAARAGRLGGAGGAVSGALAVDDLGAVSASARYRPGLGGELSGRLALPVASRVQAGVDVAWMPAQDALLAGAEARVELGRWTWSGLEVARQYRPGDTMGLTAERPVWQATAWFGVVY